MAIEIVLPRMGMTMEEGTIIAWLKKEGDKVKAGEPLIEIETDKTIVEIEAQEDGILERILADEGETLPIGTLIGFIVAEGETLPDDSARKPTTVDQIEDAEKKSTIEDVSSNEERRDEKIKASPAARRLAWELAVELSNISGTGPGGRIVAWNIEQAGQTQTTPPAQVKISPVARRLAADKGIDLTELKGTGPGGRITRRDVELVETVSMQEPAEAPPLQPLSRSHKIMSERMVTSWTSAPHFYLHTEVNARHLLAFRESLLPKIEARIGIRLTLTDLIVKICSRVLIQHTNIIARWHEEGLLTNKNINIGIAIDTPSGLIVPVIKEADKLNLEEIARFRADLVDRARGGKLLPQDLELGAFTITNLGMFRIDSFEAVLNPPQAAILAVGRIIERALVENGHVIPSPTLNLSLSIDHRVLDGVAGARFLNDLAKLIETPWLILT